MGLEARMGRKHPELYAVTDRFALFRNDEQISKAHSTWYAVAMEAYSHGAVVRWSPDFQGDPSGMGLMDGYEIRKLERVDDD